jgi:hypothetical protein
MEERYRHIKENLHKEEREVLGEEIEEKRKHRKPLYIDADLENMISEKKKLYPRRISTHSQAERNKYNILKGKMK